VELKRQFYATVVERLNAEANVRPQDVLIVLTEVAKENWLSGNGEAPYA
jgi:4-oxalocrotonate tautomerase